MLGIGVADLLVHLIGSGPWQMGLLVVLAMGVAVVLGGGPILVTEAAVSAILLVLIEPTGSGVLPGRIIEALIGGGVALAISALAFPQDPVLLVGRSVQSIFESSAARWGAWPRRSSSATPPRPRPRSRACASSMRACASSSTLWASPTKRPAGPRAAGLPAQTWCATRAARVTSTTPSATRVSSPVTLRATCAPVVSRLARGRGPRPDRRHMGARRRNGRAGARQR